MRQYIAVVKSETDLLGDNRVAKFMDFDTQAEASAHADKCGGFAAQKPSDTESEWLIDWDNQSISIKAVPEPADAYKEKRRAEYPDIGDQLDAIWKHLQSRKAGGVPLDIEADAMLSEIMSVKSKYPAK